MCDFPKGKVEHSRKEGSCTQKHTDFTYKEYLHIRYHVNEDCLRYSRQAIKKILKVVMAIAVLHTAQAANWTAYTSIRYLCMSVHM